MHYDPMIAKLVVWGGNRAAALTKLKDCLSKFQVAGVPTNISFLQKLADHRAFEEGNVETHFIEHHKDELFADPSNSLLAKEAYNNATFSATVIAACLCAKEHSFSEESLPGKNGLFSIWYSNPPFRVHHKAMRIIELDWENEYDKTGSRSLTLTVTYQSDGKYLIKTGEVNSAGVEVRATHLHDNEFRIEIDGVSMDVSLASYSKDMIEHIHLWHKSHHHQFEQKLGLELFNDDETQQKTNFETVSHALGSVVAPMAGLVVKVLAKDGTNVVEGAAYIISLRSHEDGACSKSTKCWSYSWAQSECWSAGFRW